MRFTRNNTNTNTNTSDESDSLLLSPVARTKQSESRIQRLAQGLLWNRVVLLILLTGGVAWGVLCERQILSLQQELTVATHERIQHLQDVSEQHALVIERFNASITNADVLDQLDQLQVDMTHTAHRLDVELKQTQSDIRKELDETINLLQTSVQAAEHEITDQVEKVKKDMDHYVLTTQDQFSMENSFMIYQLAGTFTVLSCLISMWHMTAHLRRLQQPDVQRKILAILWMSPVYAVTSWFSLVFRSAEGYLAIVKDFYEAYTIYQFLSFCIAVLGKGDRNVVVDLLAQHVHHLTPPFRLMGCFELCFGTNGCCCCRCCKAPRYESDRQLAAAILLQCQLFAMQFVFLRPLTTTAMVILQHTDYFGSNGTATAGAMDYRSPQLYLTIVQNISIFVAFTGLLKFYHAVDKDLAWCRPFAKFLCIKGVVFMTFWQGLALSVLAQTTDVGGDDAEGFARSSQNFLICLEMLLFSIAHFYCFPTEEWEEGYRVKHAGGKFGDSIALGDFLDDLKLLIKSNGSGGKKIKKKIGSHATIPEDVDEETEDALSTQTEALSSQTDGQSVQMDVVSVCTSPEVTDEIIRDHDRAVIAEALEESLGTLVNDPEIAEAKRRLLDSKVLSPEFFEYNDSTDGGVLRHLDDAGLEKASMRLQANDFDDIESLIERAYMNPSMEQNGRALSNESDSRVPLEASESTSLIPNRSDMVSPLRPSIFTTVASLVEEEQMKRANI